jgi:hypothetical protein
MAISLACQKRCFRREMPGYYPLSITSEYEVDLGGALLPCLGAVDL